MVESGTFREDLYYRLHVIPIQLPPLRECGEDVMLIAEKYLADYSAEERKGFKGFSGEAATAMTCYHWPGNVRQLQNVIRNIVVLQDGEEVTREMLPDLMHGMTTPTTRAPAAQPAAGADESPGAERPIEPLWLVEKRAIEDAITRCDGNIPRAAALLEISPSTIYRKKTGWED